MGGVFVDTIKRVQDLMKGQLSVETIERICQGLGITLKDFFDSSYL